MKVSILYHSESGNTRKVAELISRGVSSQPNIEVRSMSIDNVDNEFLDESVAVLFGCPTYAGSFSYQMKRFLDNVPKTLLSGKFGGVFATENYLGGGADVSLLSMVGHLLVKGMLVYSGGAANGQPYTHFGVVCIREGNEFEQQRALIFGERIAKKITELFSNKQEE